MERRPVRICVEGNSTSSLKGRAISRRVKAGRNSRQIITSRERTASLIGELRRCDPVLAAVKSALPASGIEVR